MTPTNPARVVIVDDHPLVRDGLSALLEADPMFKVCGCAEGAERAHALVRETKPDVVILDLSLGSDDGVEVARRMLVEHPATKVLILTMHYEMSLNHSVEELMNALHTVLRGERYITPEMRQRCNDRMISNGRQSPEQVLTDRELSVLRLLAAGKTAASIADDLLVAPKTIYSHRRNICAKLGLRSGREILRYAVHWSRSLDDAGTSLDGLKTYQRRMRV
jgi:DNA-binding NarL/FixJ family response regulator